MPSNKKSAKVTSLRLLRKASHISGKVAHKGGHFMQKVENRTTRLITEATGSPLAEPSIPVDACFYDAFPQLTPVYPVLPELGQKPSVTVFAFLDPKGFYGGIATLLCVAATLANKLGYDFRVAQTTGFSKDTNVLDFLASNGIIIEAKRFSTVDLSKRSLHNFGYLPLHPEDIVVVSAWWDAHIASQLPLKKKFLYLIQDFEPIFYNNSDSYILADQTYRTDDFLPICNTRILRTYFEKNGYDYIAKNATYFEPAPAPKIVSSAGKKKPGKAKRRLFLYGRPHVHRNLFYSAIKALDIALADERVDASEWELFCAGSATVPSIKLHSGNIIKNLGKMDLDQYYEWAADVDIAVAPMQAPHPNYPTLELAALGAMVVTTKWETKQDLNTYSPNILMADLTIESMAAKIVQAITTDEQTKAAGLSITNIGSDWPTALDKPLTELAENYR